MLKLLFPPFFDLCCFDAILSTGAMHKIRAAKADRAGWKRKFKAAEKKQQKQKKVDNSDRRATKKSVGNSNTIPEEQEGKRPQ